MRVDLVEQKDDVVTLRKALEEHYGFAPIVSVKSGSGAPAVAKTDGDDADDGDDVDDDGAAAKDDE